MAQPSYVTETHILRAIAVNPHCRKIWTKHAREEIAKDGRTTLDVEHSWMNGQVTDVDTAKRDILWRVDGCDLDGKGVQSIVAVFKETIVIKVVTAF